MRTHLPVTATPSLKNTVLAHLTRRELEVLRQIASGMSNQEIADHFVLSENTIKYHVHSILDKLNVPDRKEAVQFARDLGLIVD
jgi:ATP/maltotriose-dependent transcriptional regulator MalT